jgi:Spy/CpxP family protein refolding chaperone
MMYPGMMAWWKHARHAAHCGVEAGCGPSVHEAFETRFAGPPHEGDFGGGAFGVRRPLRFLAYKLELEDAQVSELAAILSDLKTERAQAAVDDRRTTAGFADSIAKDAFDATKVAEIADERVKTAARLRDAVVKALGRIHAMLKPDQREKLAYLIRTGALSI